MDYNTKLYYRLRGWIIMTKRLFVVGGNGFAKECVQYIRWNIALGQGVEFGGLVGHNGYRVDFGDLNQFFVGDLSEMNFGPDDYCIIGAGYPDLRHKIYNDILSVGGQLENLVVPYVNTPINLNIGNGNCIINTLLTECTDIKIGNGNLFNGNIVVGHDAQIGDFNFFGPCSQVLGAVKVGSDNIIGANAVLLPHSKIGNNNKIAPLSCVYRGCRDNCYMFGNPAEKVGTVE